MYHHHLFVKGNDIFYQSWNPDEAVSGGQIHVSSVSIDRSLYLSAELIFKKVGCRKGILQVISLNSGVGETSQLNTNQSSVEILFFS